MVQTIDKMGGDGRQLIFSPHLVPISRGMLSTIYVSLAEPLSPEVAQELFVESYKDAPLVRILPPGRLASMAHTQRTNLTVISITAVNPHLLILCSSIDNLGKGAAGQAVQNFNIMFGLDETAGLL
jgi:N-acetyl-gamma-glutamyl-phosphate reductase